jgi:hypothetical protein
MSRRRILITVCAAAALAVTVPAMSEARVPSPTSTPGFAKSLPSGYWQSARPCFSPTATLNLTRTIPVVPGYCLVSVRHGQPQPGTTTRGVVRYRGNHATVTIYRQGRWHWYGYTGSRWYPVTQEFGDALAEGESSPPESADTRDWESCVTNRTRTVVVCPDGFTTRL